MSQNPSETTPPQAEAQPDLPPLPQPPSPPTAPVLSKLPPPPFERTGFPMLGILASIYDHVIEVTRGPSK